MVIQNADIRQKLEEYRQRDVRRTVEGHKERVEADILGENGNEIIALNKFKETKLNRSNLEMGHLESRVAAVTLELEAERAGRRSAEKQLQQMKDRLADMEEQKAKHIKARLEAEHSLRKEQKLRQDVATNKRELEERFSKLLQAYQELTDGYEILKSRYLLVKEEKTKTSMDKFKSSLKKVKELFTQEEHTDPDKLPDFSIDVIRKINGSRGKLSSFSTGTCDFCGTDGICRGFSSSPVNPLYCICGHAKAMHDFSAPKAS